MSRSKANNQGLEKVWDQVPPGYYQQGIRKNLFQRLWHARKWMVVKRMVQGTSSRVLDVGCAGGWLTAKIAQVLPGAEVTGLDVSPGMIKYAAREYPELDFVCADAHEVPFPGGSFDLVVCTETLEHVVDPLGVLLEIRRCLSPDGQAVISMDTGNWLFNLVWFFWTKTKGRVWQGAHLHKFDRNKLKKLFKKASFKIRKERVSHLGMAVTFKLKKD